MRGTKGKKRHKEAAIGIRAARISVMEAAVAGVKLRSPARESKLPVYGAICCTAMLVARPQSDRLLGASETKSSR